MNDLDTYELSTDPISPVFREVLDEYREVYAETAPNLLRRPDYQRWSFIMERLPAGSLLDVGIGAGQFVHAAWRSGRFSRVVGVDIRPHSKLLRLDEPVEFVWANAADLPFPDDHFDVVTCMECLEHMDTDTMESAISELRRVTRKHLVMTVPWEEPEPLPEHHVQRFDAERVSMLFPTASVSLLAKKGGTWPWAILVEQNPVLSRAGQAGVKTTDA